MSEDTKNSEGTKCNVRLKEDSEKGWKVANLSGRLQLVQDVD